MVKTRYVITANAGNFLCPITPVLTSDTDPKKCAGQDCMMWIDATGTRINKGYCGLLGGEDRQSRVRAAITRMLVWLS